MKVSIEYCAHCNYLPQASSLEEELKTNLDAIIVKLVKGSGGVFKVTVDGKKIFSKRRILGRFPRKGEITKLIQHL